MEPTIETVSGRCFSFVDIENNDVHLPDIAHALAHLCRYTGHVRRFYSVAAHSLFVAMLVPERLRLYALLHDASEAYLGDVSSPLKLLLPDYKVLERRVQAHIYRSFGLEPVEPAEVKRADIEALAAERAALMPSGPDWTITEGVSRRLLPPCLYEAGPTAIALAFEQQVKSI